MSLNFLTGRGKRRALTLPEALAEIRRVNAEAAKLRAENEQLLCAVARAAIAEAEHDTRHRADAAQLRLWAGQVVRAKAEQERLRQAVINARPRITFAAPPLVPPYAAMSLPYPVPVQGADTTGDITQQLAILDLPEPLAVGWTALALAAQPA